MPTTMRPNAEHHHEAEEVPRKSKPACGCHAKTCPSCRGLECFERPRFFCGQLLTDKDLEAAQRYVVEKNRLHNRYLFGKGVVCGLAVRCDPCQDCGVLIEPGYALDCCGNDVVVCEPFPFDVCAYLERCRPKPECEDKIRPSRTRCDDVAKDYCLVLSYREEPGRPVAALVRDDGCRTARCEPSRSHETFRVDLVERKPDERPLQGGDDCQRLNGLWQRWCECEKEWERFVQVARTSRRGDPWALYCRLKEKLLDLHRHGSNTRCDLPAVLGRIEGLLWPPSRPDAVMAGGATAGPAGGAVAGVLGPTATAAVAVSATPYGALALLYMLYGQLLLDCICDALLVPCVECTEPHGVQIACLTLREGKIERICNLERTFVLTGPALRHWFGPLWSGLTDRLEEACCREDPFQQLMPAMVETRMVGPATLGQAARSPAMFSGLMRLRHVVEDRLKDLDLTSIFEPGAIHAGNVLGRDVKDVRSQLQNKGIALTERRLSPEEASSLEHLLGTHWVVPADAVLVEAIVDPQGIVTGFRVLKTRKDE